MPEGVVLWQEKIPVFLRGVCFENALKHCLLSPVLLTLAYLHHVIGINGHSITLGRNAPAERLITLTYVRVCSFRLIPVVTNPEFLFEPRAETEQRAPWSVL